MKYAIFNNRFVTASRSRKGAICPLCKANVIPKCGEIRIHHWSHKKGTMCDSWREADSQWRHRWLERFEDCEIEPVIENVDQRHFADIRTKNGTLILLRRKLLGNEDMLKMERFFRNLVWIVDVKKQNGLYGSFQKAFDKGTVRHLFRNAYSASCECWGSWEWSRVPVVFDFSGMGHKLSRKFLWCLIPQESSVFNERRLLLCYSRERMIELLKERVPLSPKEFQENLHRLNRYVQR